MRGLSINIETGDLEVANGKLVMVDDTTSQEIELVLRSNRGEFKELPLIGGEYIKLANGTATALWAAQLKKQLISLGYQVNDIKIDNNIITIS